MICTYVYRRPCGEPFYVGVGSLKRPYIHLSPRRWQPYDPEYPSFYGQLRKMFEAGQEPTVEVIFQDPDRKLSEELESLIIEECGLVSEGGMLYNWHPGRGGMKKGEVAPWPAERLQTYRKWHKENRKYKIEADDLYDLYITQNMTRQAIGKVYGCSDVTVKARLKEYGIRKMK